MWAGAEPTRAETIADEVWQRHRLDNRLTQSVTAMLDDAVRAGRGDG
jgi:hypothetical protein